MIVSHKYKFIVIDIPKTGTNSYSHAIHSMGIIPDIQGGNSSNGFYQHDIASLVKNKLEKLGHSWGEYYSIVRVRNPWKSYASLFYWHLKNYNDVTNKKIRDTLTSQQYKTKRYSASLFIENRFKEDKIMSILIRNAIPQCEYFTENNQIIVSHIGCFENLQEEFNDFCKRINVKPLQLEKQNSSPTYNYKDLYENCPELIEKVAEKEHYVISLKKYSYD